MAWREKAVFKKVVQNIGWIKTLYLGGDPLNGTDPTQVTSSAAELNKLDGFTGDVDDLLGVVGVATKATFTVGAEDTNSINVAVQLTDETGDDVAEINHVRAYLSDSATGDGVCATAPDGDIAVGTDGTIIYEDVADKVFQIQTEADGEFDVDIGEASTGTWYLVVILPNGTQAVSGAITFA